VVIAQFARKVGRHTISALAIAPTLTKTAAAHAGEGGEILLLPTKFYILGGGLAVLVSFGALALFHRHHGARSEVQSVTSRAAPRRIVLALSLMSLTLLVVLLWAGFAGKPDPLSNPLPLFVWTLWWMGFTLLVVVAGNVWSMVNPWIGLYELCQWRAPLRYHEHLGYLPASVLFFGFAWFELIYPTPQDPQRLALAITAYWSINFIALLLFGPRWLVRGEAFSAFFAMAGSFSPLRWQMVQQHGRVGVSLNIGWRGRRLGGDDFSDLTGTLFVLATLAAVSFDGLSRTFTWAGWLKINPLEFPGRSAVIWPNTLGLAAGIAVLGGLYVAAIASGPYRTGLVCPLPRALSLFVLSLAPISIAYHLAHYLPSLIVGFPSAILALFDPFGLGWSLLPQDTLHAGSSMGLGGDQVVMIYRVQTAIIVAGHIVATLMAHRTVMAQTEDHRKAVISQIPLAALMVFYTLFGLWLLSTPQIG
jgi:hypothetical protein